MAILANNAENGGVNQSLTGGGGQGSSTGPRSISDDMREEYWNTFQNTRGVEAADRKLAEMAEAGYDVTALAQETARKRQAIAAHREMLARQRAQQQATPTTQPAPGKPLGPIGQLGQTVFGWFGYGDEYASDYRNNQGAASIDRWVDDAIWGGDAAGFAARERGIDFLNDNELAYLKGNQKWQSGKVGDTPYNNVLVVQDGSDYTKVYRNFNDGVYTFVGSESMTQQQYTAFGGARNTYCNIAATKIGLEYGAPNLQNYGGGEYNANAVFDNLKSGFYNSDAGSFDKVDFKIAEAYARNGGFAVATLKKSGGTGHIATLTGGYGGNGEATMNNLNIFQAGSKFGAMTYYDGFRRAQSDFYIWRPVR